MASWETHRSNFLAFFWLSWDQLAWIRQRTTWIWNHASHHQTKLTKQSQAPPPREAAWTQPEQFKIPMWCKRTSNTTHEKLSPKILLRSSSIADVFLFSAPNEWPNKQVQITRATAAHIFVTSATLSLVVSQHLPKQVVQKRTIFWVS